LLVLAVAPDTGIVDAEVNVVEELVAT